MRCWGLSRLPFFGFSDLPPPFPEPFSPLLWIGSLLTLPSGPFCILPYKSLSGNSSNPILTFFPSSKLFLGLAEHLNLLTPSSFTRPAPTHGPPIAAIGVKTLSSLYLFTFPFLVLKSRMPLHVVFCRACPGRLFVSCPICTNGCFLAVHKLTRFQPSSKIFSSSIARILCVEKL